MQVRSTNQLVHRESSARDAEPIPPHFWWLKRGAIGFGLLLVLLTALRLWWGHEAQRRMDALARAAHARGEPFYREDYRQAPVPDAENAAVPIQTAIGKLQRDAIPDLTNGSSEPPMSSEMRSLDAMIRHYQPELLLMHSARSRPRVSFSKPLDLDTTASGWMGQILVSAANYKHASGDEGAAVEYMHDALMFADALDESSMTIIPHLVATMITGDTFTLLERISPELSISDHSSQGASPDQLRSLIATLLDERAVHAGAVRGTQGEGTRAINFVPDEGLMSDPLVVRVLNPVYKFDGARVYEFESDNAQAYSQPTFPAARAKLKALSISKTSTLGMLANPVGVWYVDPTPDLPVRVQFKSLTERRIVAVMLAIRLYIADHQDKLPLSLADLVPAYLPAVPRDPFDPANGSIRYLPMREPPVLYSVGLNGKDDRGSEKYLPFSESMMPRWHNEDVVYPLRARSSNSPAQDHQSKKEK